jgi:ribonuclease P protein subunit RPR2
MQKEKKIKGNQKIALERIYRLFELAVENEEYAKRYLQLAKRIGEKTRVSIPKEIKEKYCKKCYSLNVTQAKKEPFLEVTCKECGFVKKFGIKVKLKGAKQEKA